MSDTHNNNGSQIYGIIVTLLLLCSAGIGWFFWNKSRTMMVENDRKKVIIDSLGTIKQNLERSLDSLQLAYSDLRMENEALAGKITAKAGEIARKDSQIQQIKQVNINTLGNIAALQAQITALQQAKNDYESVIAGLREENAVLKNENVALRGDINQLKGKQDSLASQISLLSDKLAAQIRETHAAAFRATAFKVDSEKKNDKITVRAKRVREILVSFDLVNVPAQYWGSNKLYLVLTDEKGKTLPSDAPLTPVVLQTPQGRKEIEAHAIRPINIEKAQRPTMNFVLSEKLKSGTYVAAVYCDNGTLGATSFKLR